MKASPLGITKHLDDAALHQFANSKTQKPVSFSYEAFHADGKEFGVITIPVQERPLYLKMRYGRLKEQVVYIRRGSSTGTATPDEMRMGKKRLPTGRVRKVRTTVQLTMPSPPEGILQLHASLSNIGKATAYDTTVIFERQPNPGSLHFENNVWRKWKRGGTCYHAFVKRPFIPVWSRSLQIGSWAPRKFPSKISSMFPMEKGPIHRNSPCDTAANRYPCGSKSSLVTRLKSMDWSGLSLKEIEAKTAKRFACSSV